MKRMGILLALALSLTFSLGCDDNQEAFDADDTGPSSVVPDGTPADNDALDD